MKRFGGSRSKIKLLAGAQIPRPPCFGLMRLVRHATVKTDPCLVNRIIRQARLHTDELMYWLKAWTIANQETGNKPFSPILEQSRNGPISWQAWRRIERCSNWSKKRQWARENGVISEWAQFNLDLAHIARLRPIKRKQSCLPARGHFNRSRLINRLVSELESTRPTEDARDNDNNEQIWKH